MCYLTALESKQLERAFFNDPTTEDMTFGEYLRWMGWRWDERSHQWYKQQ